MTRMSTLRLVLAIALLSSCEMIADIPERSLVSEPCDQFCELAGKLCTGTYSIYKPAECNAVCALYSKEDRQCRLDELKKLERSGEDEASLYCANASLSGGDGVCGGSSCKVYCNAVSKVCADFAESTVHYPDADGSNAQECETKCAIVPDRTRLPHDRGESTFDVVRDHEGDTLQCRFVHLSLAAQSVDLADDHCLHAYVNPQPMGMGKNEPPWCGSPKTDGVPRCEDYCEVNIAACVDDQKVYDNKNQCLNACKALPLGKLDTSGGTNSVACRKYHSYNAGVYDGKADVHCKHAGPGGAGVCGDDCESLCLLVAKACPDEYESEFGGAAQRCQKSCDDARKADPKYGDGFSVANAKQGNAFACRLYHATLASSFANDAQSECAVAIGKAKCPFPETK